MSIFKPFLAAASVVAFASVANAQATRTWVSGVGDDVNPCSRTAPCKTFAGAISKTATGGEINVIDPGGFGAVTINKSITIDGAGTQASILALNVNGILINGAGATVNLRNLSINGAGGTTGNGIRILQAGGVNLDNVTLMNFAGSGTNGRGITIETATSAVRVNVSNSLIYNMENHGIDSSPTAGNVILVVDNTSIARGGQAGINLRENDCGVDQPVRADQQPQLGRRPARAHHGHGDDQQQPAGEQRRRNHPRRCGRRADGLPVRQHGDQQHHRRVADRQRHDHLARQQHHPQQRRQPDADDDHHHAIAGVWIPAFAGMTNR